MFVVMLSSKNEKINYPIMGNRLILMASQI